jgi:PIN domain nuclease of toxin-antitoxin system
MPALLLDTCADIFIAEGSPIEPKARRAVLSALVGEGVLVSPVSAWEIGMLAARKGIAFRPDPAAWLREFLDRDGVRLAPLTPEAAIAASFLPQPLHADPADRLLIATSRELDAPIVTRDRAILAYAKAGGVRAVGC